MLTFKATVDVSSAVAALKDIRETQIPYATSRALNDTALSARQAVLSRAMAGIFKFKTNPNWIKSPTRGWFRTVFSDKRNLVAWIEGLQSYLVLQEEGGVRTRHGGGLLAIPIGPLAARAIPKEMRPRYLLGQDYAALLSMASNTKISALRHKRALAGYGSGFLMHHDGHTLIVRRTGPKSLQFCYVLVPAVAVHERLEFFRTVQATAQREFAGFFAKRMAEAMQSAR